MQLQIVSIGITVALFLLLCLIAAIAIGGGIANFWWSLIVFGGFMLGSFGYVAILTFLHVAAPLKRVRQLNLAIVSNEQSAVEF